MRRLDIGGRPDGARFQQTSRRDEVPIVTFIGTEVAELFSSTETEASVSESTEQLEAILGAIPDLIWLRAVDGAYLACNQRFEQFTGAKAIDVLGKTHYDFQTKDVTDLFRDPTPFAEEGGTNGMREAWVTFESNGKGVLLEISKKLLRTSDGRVVGILGIGHDITERYHQHQAVDREQIRLRDILKTASDGIHILDANGILVEANDAFLHMMGLQREAIGTLSVASWDVQRSLSDIVAFNRNLIESEGRCLFETRHRRADGTIIDVEISASGTVIDGAGYLYAASRDITLRKQMQSALEESERRYRTILEWTPEPIVVQKGSKLIYLNPAAVTLFGARSAEELISVPVISLVHPDYRQISIQRSRNLNEGGKSNPLMEQKFLKLDGSTIHVEVQSTWIEFDGEPAVLVVIRDITERHAASEKINHLAFYDSLTGLPNRRLMQDRLEQALMSSTRQKCHGSLIMIDLDNFKLLNDTLGHATGDLLLVEAASRLRACVRECDTVARMGGDEFVVVLKDLGQGGMADVQAGQVANKILTSLGQTYALGYGDASPGEITRTYHCTSSVGIAMFRDQSISANELLKRADTAMYEAKAAGKNTLRFFNLEMQADVARRAEMEVELRKAISERQLVLHYQAQVNSEGQIVGAEALVRWQHPTRGLIPPNEFIGLAEDCGLILQLGQLVMEDACEQLEKWSKSTDLCDITVAVNVSARQFVQASFVEQVLDVTARFQIPPGQLKLELTEGLLLENTELVIDKMTLLRSKGILFSLDDFGTGYSSLSYLKFLPLDQLKIDRSFIKNVLSDPNDAAIARMVVALGRSLGLNVIAEGVETAEQRDFLITNQCYLFQGYLYSRPLPARQFEDFYLSSIRSNIQQ